MNKNLEKALREQKTRSDLKNAVITIRERTVLQEENLYKTFVQPFADVFDALKITSKDILSNTMLAFGQVLTLSPEKQKERMKKYEERQRKIEAEWKPLMDKADKVLGSGDADIVALAYAPGLYLASAAGATAYNAAEGVGKYLDDLGLKKGVLSILPGVSDSSVSDSTSSSSDSEENEKSLLDKLNTLFLGTAIASGIGLGITKGKKKTKTEGTQKLKNVLLEDTKSNFVKDFKKFRDDTGLTSEFESMQSRLENYYRDYIEEINKDYDARENFVNLVKNSKSVKDLYDNLDKVKNTNLEKEADTVMKDYESSKEKLVKSEDFRKSVSEKVGSEEVSDQQIEEYADKALFADFMTNITESLKKNLEVTKQKIGKELAEILPKQKSMDMVKTTKEGIPFFSMIRDTKNKYNIS